jgi:hypothetical protein
VLFGRQVGESVPAKETKGEWGGMSNDLQRTFSQPASQQTNNVCQSQTTTARLTLELDSADDEATALIVVLFNRTVPLSLSLSLSAMIVSAMIVSAMIVSAMIVSAFNEWLLGFWRRCQFEFENKRSFSQGN